MSEMYMLDGYLSLVLIKTNQLHPPMQMAEENGNTHFTIHNIVQNLNDLTFFSLIFRTHLHLQPKSTNNHNTGIKFPYFHQPGS